MQPYHDIERLGLTLWNTESNSDRWKLLRVGAASHNLLLIDGRQPEISGRALLTSAAPRRAVYDLSELYRASAKKTTREFIFAPPQIVIVDQIAGVKKGAKITFQFCSTARAAKINGAELTLTQNGKTLTVTAQIENGADAIGAEPQWTTRECEELRQPYEQPNPQHRMFYLTAYVGAVGAAPRGFFAWKITFQLAPTPSVKSAASAKAPRKK
jgi:hypothetical protein